MIAVPIAPPTRRDPSPNGSWTGDPNAIVIDDEVGGRHLFVVDGSRLYELDDDTYSRMAHAVGEHRAADELARLGLTGAPFVDDQPLVAPPVRAVSLAVAQKCNLGCSYCYAQQGDFGMESRLMSLAEAEQAIDLVLAESAPQDRIADRAPTRDDGQDLELPDVLPGGDPPLQQRDVVALHDLEYAS